MSDSPSVFPKSEKEIFLAALERENPLERETYVRDECLGDDALLQRVQRLLRASGETGHFLDAKRFSVVEEELGALAEDIQSESRFMADLGKAIQRLGDYELLEEIGRGASGVVYRARQVSLNREVAVKVILGTTWMTSAGRRRFRQEAEAAAGLNHRHIVPVYEIGHYRSHDYYSMAYIPGGTLGRHLKEIRKDRKKAVSLIAKVAHTMQVAHNRGIFHRDLKPDNILLGEEGEPLVSDFGLAYDLTQSSGLTLTGQILGTPQYMAPEQAVGDASEISAQTDIYSMGAILYVLLSGRTVIEADSFMGALQRLAEETPPRLGMVDSSIDRDLEVIVAKCLERNPADRYPSAESLAEDLEAWLDNRPISARRQTLAQRVLKWTKRKPVHAALSGSLVLLLLSLGIGGPLMALRQVALREIAEKARAEAIEAAELANQRAYANRRLAYASNMRLITMAAHLGTTPTIGTQTMLNGLRPGAAEDDFRDWEWYYAFGNLHLPTIRFGQKGPINSLEFSPFGESFLVSNPRGTTIFDTLTRVMGRRMRDGEEHLHSSWSTDEQMIVTLGKSGKTTFWNSKTAESIASLPEDDPALSVSWGSAGKRLAVLHSSNTIGIWSSNKAPRLLAEKLHPPAELEKIAWSPDGQYLAGIGKSSKVFVWDIEAPGAPLEVYQGHKSQLTKLAWMYNSAWLATGSVEGAIRIWRVPGGRRVANIGMNNYWEAPVTSLVWDPDGHVLLHTIKDLGKIMQLDFALNANNDFHVFEGHISALAWNAEAHSIVAGSADGKIAIWRDGLPEAARILHEGEAPLASVQWSPDGAQVICVDNLGTLTAFSATTGQRQETTILDAADADVGMRSDDPSASADFSRDGMSVAPNEARAWHPAGQYFATLDSAGKIAIRSVEEQEPIRRFQARSQTASALAWHPDGNRLVSGGVQGELIVWDWQSGEPLLELPGHRDRVADLAWDREGRRLASASHDGTLRIWDATAGILLSREKTELQSDG